MHKKIILLLLSGFISLVVHAQSTDVYNRYVDFNVARTVGEKDKIRELGEKLVPDADKLPEKARINFYFYIGKMYQDNNQPGRAIPYFEKVIAAVPGYHLAHLALGYIYLENVRKIGDKLNASVGNKTLNTTLTVVYNEAARKALLYLEKAQACNPSDQTLAIIKVLYKNIKDLPALNSLNDRFSKLNKDCVDLITED